MKNTKEVLEDQLSKLKSDHVELHAAVVKKANEVNTLNQVIEQHKGAVSYNERWQQIIIQQIASLTPVVEQATK